MDNLYFLISVGSKICYVCTCFEDTSTHLCIYMSINVDTDTDMKIYILFYSCILEFFCVMSYNILCYRTPLINYSVFSQQDNKTAAYGLRNTFLLSLFYFRFSGYNKNCQNSSKLQCAALTFFKLFTCDSEIVLNHQLRNVQKLITISWHLQNRSVTKSLAVELKSFYTLCTAEASWCHSSLI